MAILLGVLVALSYGAGDFLGGLSSRRLSPITVVQGSQFVGVVGLSLTVALLPDQHLVGLLLLYRGLAVGAMSIVAPVTAVGAAVLPVAWGLLQGERPGALALAGVALALAAVALVSTPDGQDDVPAGTRTREIALALVAGAAFGVVFVLFADTSDRSGLYPVAAARVVSFSAVSVGLLLLRGQAPAVPPPGARLLVAATGVFDAGANTLFLLAAREGLLSLVAPVSSLYPAATIVLAAVVLGERVGRRQQVGLVAALAGVLVIAV